MTDALKRRTVLQAGAAMLGAAMVPATTARAQRSGGYEFLVKDIVYQRSGGRERLARLYQPAGPGPFPAVLQVHGGAWNDKDRTDGQNTSLELAEAGIVVLAIDFRNAGEAPYPASLQDINYGMRWLKAHANEFGSSAGQVGAYGTSSGGHQALLAAIRPDDPRYRALPLAEVPEMDAKLAFVVTGWGVLFPLERYKLAKAQGKAGLAKDHDRILRQRGDADRGDAGSDPRARRKGLSAAGAGVPGHQRPVDHGRTRRALRRRLPQGRRQHRSVAARRRAPHLPQRASIRSELEEGARDHDRVYQAARLGAPRGAVMQAEQLQDRCPDRASAIGRLGVTRHPRPCRGRCRTPSAPGPLRRTDRCRRRARRRCWRWRRRYVDP